MSIPIVARCLIGSIPILVPAMIGASIAAYLLAAKFGPVVQASAMADAPLAAFIVGLPIAFYLRWQAFRLEAANEQLKDALQTVEAARQEAMARASIDGLTGLLNRNAYFEAAENAHAIAARSVVLMMDLDHFKGINDTYGHGAGDDVLVASAAKLKAILRRGDIVGRIGGEEFAIMLPDTTLREGLGIADAILKTFEGQPAMLQDGRLVDSTISVGVAAGLSEDDLRNMHKTADESLYRAKAAGRNRVVLAEAV
ncbi:MAG: GGDEF domain-containing protein [Pseudomonadota bacterium]